MSSDDRHILVTDDGTEWLRDPRFDSEQRLKDMPEELAAQYRTELPIRMHFAGFNQAVVHVYPDMMEWDGSDTDPQSRFLGPLQVHVHTPNGESVTMMHLHGLAVHQDEEGIQQVDDDSFEEELDLITQLYEPDHPYYTATLENGRSYVLYGVPYC